MNVKKWRVPKEPRADKQIQEVKKILKEKTDTKVILWLINWGHGTLIRKKK